MKYIRLLLRCLLPVVVLAALLAAAAFAPMVQTWVAQWELGRQPGLKGTLGALSAGLGKVELTDLHLEGGGAVLTVPSLQAALPVKSALWNGRVLVGSLVAKGWTLDLSGAPQTMDAPAQNAPAGDSGGPADAPAQAEPEAVQTIARTLVGVVGAWKLPWELSLDGVDLDGDVVVAVGPGKAPSRLHVTVKGGGMSAGREGAFTVEASGSVVDASLQVITLGARGRLVVAMDSPRTFARIGLTADLPANGAALPEDLALAADVAVARATHEETYRFDLTRGNRHVATVLGRFPDAVHRVTGTWKVDLQDSDLAPFAQDRPLPAIAATGDGDFDADAVFGRLHVRGHLGSRTSRLESLAPSLDRLGAVTVDARFDLTHNGQAMRVDSLTVALAGDRPAAVVRSLQPFDLDEKSLDLKVQDPAGDWLEGTVQGIPLKWFSGVMGDFAFDGGEVAGGFVVRAADGGFSLRPRTPLTAAGVSLLRDGKIVAQGLDFNLSPLADYDAKGWQVQWAPLAVSSGGQSLATIEGKASKPMGADQPVTVSVNWNANLEALASRAAVPGIPWIRGHSATGDFTASTGMPAKVEGKLTVIGRDAAHSLTVNLRADVYGRRQIDFHAPIRIAAGPGASEVSLNGTWMEDGAGGRFDARLTGSDVVADHLRMLAVPAVAAGGGASAPDNSGGNGASRLPAVRRDRVPFWGGWVGRLAVAFDHLRVANRDFTAVRGTFDLDHGSLGLKDGMGGISNHGLTNLQGSILFDPAAESPYQLKASAAFGDIEAKPYFPGPAPGDDPQLEGHFAVAATAAGSGANLDDLISRTQEEFRLTSTGGVVRLLKTSVAESIPEPDTPVKDALSSAGSVVGSLFGIKRDAGKSDQIQLRKNTRAVIDFTYQIAEFEYDQLSVTAVRKSDGTVNVPEFALTAGDEHITGSGRIGYVPGRPLRSQPLSLEMQFGARGKLAELMTTAGLLSSQKDGLGYTLLGEPVHFGGTLGKIDGSEWHDLLVKAALRKPDDGKGGGTTAAPAKN